MSAFDVVTTIGMAMVGGEAALLLLLRVGIARTDRRTERRTAMDTARHRVLTTLAELQTADHAATAEAAVTRIRATLTTLRGAELRDALTSLAGAVSGESLAALRGIAHDLGLLDQAEGSARDGTWVERLLAVRCLAALRVTSDSVPRLLGDSHPSVRAQAAQWVVVNDAPENIDALEHLLVDPNPRCRFEAKDTLARLGGRASGLVSRLLRSPDPRLQRNALEIACSVGNPAYLPALRHIASTGVPLHRALAATALSATGEADVLDLLRELLEDPEATVRLRAVSAIAATADWRCATLIAPCLDDVSHAVRRETGLGLLQLGAPGLILLRESAAHGAPEAPVAAQFLAYRSFTAGRA